MEFTKTQIREGIWHLGDDMGNFCTLIIGGKKAVLFDTMMGLHDLQGFVATLTDLEPMVINSHCHFDHAGGNYQFGKGWMSRLDDPLVDEAIHQLPTLSAHFKADLTEVYRSFDRANIAFIEAGEVLDLGGKTVEVIPMPGHTPGSIGLLCREDRLLLAGDGISPQMCLFFPESLTPEEYRTMLRGLWDLPFDGFVTGHFNHEFPKSALEKFDACVDIIGKKRGMDYAFSALPEKTGLFYIKSARDPELGELLGIVVKKS